MDYRIYKEDDFSVSSWTGGKTRQLAIFPENSNYLERNFLWRLSSATCEMEESNFSKLPDYDRVLVVLEGKVVLAHDGVRVARLNPLEQDRFDGGYKTKSFGKITDYNLMVAKGNQGFVDVITLSEESTTPELEKYPEYGLHSQCYYCVDGFATISAGGETLMLSQGQQLVVNYTKEEQAKISIMGEGNVIRCQIFYDYEQGDLGPVVVPAEKATFDDFKACAFIANTQFRGAKFIFKSLKTRWFDEALSGAIKKIERLYLPYFVFLIGLMIIALFGVDKFSVVHWIISLTAWLLIDMFVVSPAMYMAVVPKPVRKHIKDVNNLTPYEQKVFEKEMGTNERLERLMKKYKYSGKEVYDKEGNRIDKTY